MNNLEKFKSMQLALVSVKARIEDGEFLEHGICSYVDYVLYELDKLDFLEISEVNTTMNRLMQQWPEYSGCGSHIIGQNPEDAKRLYIHGEYSRRDLCSEEWYWSNKSPYGRKRRELLAWLINRCEEITGKVL